MLKNNKEKRSAGACAFGIVMCLLTCALLLVAVALRMISEWYDTNYEMSFKELLYTLCSPLEGTGDGMIGEILDAVLPAVIAAFVIYVVFGAVTRGKRAFGALGLVLSVALLVNAGAYAWKAFGISEYVRMNEETTTLYEDYYVDPDNVLITADGKTKNLIYLYIESMETTYASTDVGGIHDENYIPLLTQLAMENVSFSDKSEGMMGGFVSVNGTGWTIAALLATLGGIPFAFPIEDVNKMDERESFASGITMLGDILEEKGYRQTFLCGSDVDFGGRRKMFEQHGNYELLDLYSAREMGYIEEDYYVWWGYEDLYLYEIAKDKITELAKGDQPFNFTMLTVDTHAVDGYVCAYCGNDYENPTANVVKCADRQAYEFIEWCKQQEFYEDTVIVVTGDHPRHDQQLIGDTGILDRSVYNCFINSAVEPAGNTFGREFSSFDMFPTVLAAMGFQIEGQRLGLGVNMFSGETTVTEVFGKHMFNYEISKYSEYYILNFS